MTEMESERRAPTPEEHFGMSAGKVYWALNEEKAQSINQIVRETKLRKDDVLGALGWLAREGKIEIAEDRPMRFKRL
jgi:hypothetical protein